MIKSMIKGLAAASLVAISTHSFADDFSNSFNVTITNITKGIQFTPFLAATHNRKADVFEVGEAPSDALAAVAEGGDIGPLMGALVDSPFVSDVQSTAGLLSPGESVTFEIVAGRKQRLFSLVSMLLPTNDSFAGMDSVRLPYRGSKTYFVNAYDAGSEPNDEFCMNIPGPACGGIGTSPGEGGEGYVYPSPGIHGEAELSQAAYDWNGPVLKVTIQAPKKSW
jgi:hypothetical protein